MGRERYHGREGEQLGKREKEIAGERESDREEERNRGRERGWEERGRAIGRERKSHFSMILISKNIPKKSEKIQKNK